MQHLSGSDTFFLTLEDKRQPMHVAAMGIYDPSSAPGGTVRFKTILDFFATKINKVPFFRRRLIHAPMGIGRPQWIEDGDVDVEFHVRHIALPAPGDWRQLMIQVARIHSRHMDLTQPLWEAYVIGGLDNIDGVAKGSFALYLKMHHAGIDGQASAKLIQILHTLTPDYNPVAKPSVVYVDKEPSGPELILRGMINRGMQAAKASELTLLLGKKAIDLGSKYAPSAISNIKDMLADTVGIGEKTIKRTHTRFDNILSSHRVVDAFSLSMSDIKTIRNNIPGATVNDIFMASVGGGLRSYLSAHNELPDVTLSAVMPMAATGDNLDKSSANNISMISVPVCTDVKDPIARLHALKQGANKGKEVLEDLGRDLIPKVLDAIPSNLSKKLTELTLFKESSLTISNVRGPDVPLYLAGAKMQMFMPISIPFDGVGLNVTGFSYAGDLWVTLTSCRKMLPDPGFLTTCLKGAFNDLLEASIKANEPENTPQPAVKKPVTRKPAARKPAARKPAARKPAAKKVAAKTPRVSE